MKIRLQWRVQMYCALEQRNGRWIYEKIGNAVLAKNERKANQCRQSQLTAITSNRCRESHAYMNPLWMVARRGVKLPLRMYAMEVLDGDET